MKVKVTKEEREKLKFFHSILNDLSQPLARRRWAKAMFDMVYNEALLRN